MFPQIKFEEFKTEDFSNIALTYAINMAVILKKNQLFTVRVPTQLTQYSNLTVSKNDSTPSTTEYSNDQSFILPKKIQPNNAKINAVGIDLGTSRCCAAVNRRNGIETVALDYKGERLLPSFIAFDEAHIKCGQIVIDRLRHYSKSTIFDSKRIIGREFSDIEIDESWPFTVILDNDNKNVMLEVKTFDGRNQISPESASASLLKYIKQKVEEFQGQKSKHAVITVPAAFTEAQKMATLKAAKLAGFEKIALLPEPVAASFAYFINRPIPNNSKILLFDLGGGTLDVCIFKIQNNQIFIISNTGDSKLGGRDFDKILINYFLNIFNSKFCILLADGKKYKLMQECQKIKENLSNSANSCLDVEEFDASKEGELISISQKELQKMTTSLMNRIQNTIFSALQSSAYTPDQIDKVLQVGGGSRMPMIKNLLQNLFPKAEHCCEENPDEVVAIGAAYYAYTILDNSK
uniref:Heat shock protein 70 n=1 Tax=Panagrolaimus sp. ES5 TaxID=591445 RepID=A0AC34FQQ7_9BILA